MHQNQFKYQNYLDKFPNCPPVPYREIDRDAYRWVHDDDLENSFIPLNIMQEPPPRVLDKTDLMCKGYGLSLFDTFENGQARYQALYKRKRGLSHEEFVKGKGNAIAKLEMNGTEGTYGDLNKKNGHFTFHEKEGTKLAKKIVTITEIQNKAK